jgi:hypothetical protein
MKMVYEMGTDKLSKFFLPSVKIWIAWGRAAFEMVGPLEKIVAETGDLPLHFAGCGSAVCVWGCGAGAVPDFFADV